jgi:ATP-dependent Clp protease ATP-binding subunit ClpB
MELDEAATEWLADQGYYPVYGARPLKRVIQKKLQDALATKLLAGEIADGDHVVVTGHDLGLKIETVKP